MALATTTTSVPKKIAHGLNTLVRINKKAIIPDLSVQTLKIQDDKDNTSTIEINDVTMKKVLGELYRDIKYLQQLKDSIGKNRNDYVDLKITAIADAGLTFLMERGEYWDNLGPLPPLVVKKSRRKICEKTYKGSIDSLRSNVTRSTITTNPLAGKKKSNSLRPLLQFNFQSYRPPSRNQHLDSNIRRKQNTPTPPERVKHFDVNVDNLNKADIERKQQIYQYFKKALEDIKRDFVKEYFESCEKQILECSEALSNFKEDIIEKRREIEIKLENMMGDLKFKTGYCDQAIHHYHKALDLTQPLRELRLLTLGNIGRVYSHVGEHNKALETFTEQSRLSRSDTEIAGVFLSLGQCFLSLHQYESAKDCGRKSFEASRRAKNHHVLVESLILLAISLARLNKFEHAARKLTKAKKLTMETGSTFLQNLVRSAEKMIVCLNKHRRLIQQMNSNKNQKEGGS